MSVCINRDGTEHTFFSSPVLMALCKCKCKGLPHRDVAVAVDLIPLACKLDTYN